jgi:hypothetical protein
MAYQLAYQLAYHRLMAWRHQLINNGANRHQRGGIYRRKLMYALAGNQRNISNRQ